MEEGGAGRRAGIFKERALEGTFEEWALEGTFKEWALEVRESPLGWTWEPETKEGWKGPPETTEGACRFPDQFPRLSGPLPNPAAPDV